MTRNHFNHFRACSIACILLVLTGPASHATTLWTGPNTNWTKSGATPVDVILAGKVSLTRGSRLELYNTNLEASANGTTSPKGTLWAFGTFASHTAFQTMGSMRNGDLATVILNKPMVMWITNDDIFVSVMFTAWGKFGSGTVSYTRSTPPTAVPPTVSITSPAPGSVFAAPASVALRANAAVSGGTVTNVEYFAGTTSLGRATVSPFSVSGNLPTAGSYALKAVATAGGISATSAAVNITVIQPAAVSLTPPTLIGGIFAFDYNVDPGLRYVVERATTLGDAGSPDWVSLVTNAPANSPAHFSEAITNSTGFYRVGRLPNP
ncbi:MAG TPA: Ig-like domain-containing protein [Candidatus Saccharimonadales bacterium]|nr:Ig-like domain-containing protein [Candidatus Saccharimonadales bacterium]